MIKYPKILSLYERDMEPGPMRGKVMVDKLKTPEFGMVNRWHVTEKIHGTNIRVWLNTDGTVHYGGRTDKAQLYMPLVEHLQAIFQPYKLHDEFDVDEFDRYPEVCLFGEGYGPKIQKGGGGYANEPSFRLFDVWIDGWWLNWDSVCDIASKFDIMTVPHLATIFHLPRSVTDIDILFGAGSIVAATEGDPSHKAEGIVARTDPLLRFRNGDRLMWKLKYRDFPQENP